MSSLERAALAVLLPGFGGTSLGDGPRRLLDEGLGGVCLYGANTADGPDAVAALTAAINEVAGAVVAVDEEGGDVTRLHAAEGSPVLGALALGAADDLALTRQVGRQIGSELAALGVTMTLAPVADVNSRPDNPVIGTRSFGTDPDRVAAHVAAWTGGVQGAGAAACVKHWPGHGDTDLDSHLDLPRLDAGDALLHRRELAPFRAAVEAGVAAVMTAHIVVPAWDPDRPATLSATALARLRDELGFTGVLVSDALDMAGASAAIGIPGAAVLALAAGCDLLCLGADPGAADAEVRLVRDVQAAIVAAVHDGRLPEERLAEAAGRVAALPRPAPGQRYDEADPVLLRAGAAAAVTLEGTLPDLRGARVVRVDSPGTIAVGDVPWGLPVDGPFDELPDGLPALPLVVQVRDAHRQPHVAEALARVAGRDAVVVEWGWPGPATTGLPRICSRGWSRPGRSAVEELLRSAGWDR
ncbi:glycoside hydrolase family 3 N-terminal domain-containing protein [Nocardioides sp.]|uniref:glycoside hydrolase family 3 N-terminal domain-containing protein n=1 Tax=Nocardioides sp. TaxID=35761 RepID=UPI0025E728C6|nr:glycoside hydrolase family 3 N-terminal domain-containing protein [Nocardioides sp.]